jgi:hypothetical protein
MDWADFFLPATIIFVAVYLRWHDKIDAVIARFVK